MLPSVSASMLLTYNAANPCCRCGSYALLHTNQMLSSKSKVPRVSCWKPTAEQSVKMPELEDDLVKYLERTSLVRFSTEDSRRQLRDAINFANQLKLVDTDGVEPLHTLLENECVYTREDVITEGDCRDKLMSLASKTVENCYYVAPPGNIPLDQEVKDNKRKGKL